MGNSTKELVNAFNLNNYACDKISTNFTVEGKKIVGLFAGDTHIGEYLRRMEKKIIGRHYGTREIANEYYNLDCFPFVSGANHDEEYLGNGIVKVKLAGSTNNEVICNLKVHFANEFKRAVRAKVAACLQEEVGITREEAYEWIIETVKTGAIGKPYLYCIAFSNEYLEREYDLETFEFFKQAYIKEFNSRLENCGLKSSDFYEYKDDMLYVKNVSDKVIKSVTECVKKEVAFDFRTPGTEDSKVENFKDVLGDFIFKWTGKSINAYEYDIFTDKKTIEKGSNFVLIPLTKRYSGQLESLKHKDAYKVNIIHKDFVSDIRGKTARPDVASYENPVYAISNRRIAQLLPEIMQSPIAYNKENKRFEFAVDLENFKRRGSSRSSSTVASLFNSPTHAGPSGLRTPPNKRKKDTDSGYDSNSPPRLKDYVAPSTSGGPGPSSSMEWESSTHLQNGWLPGRRLDKVEVELAQSRSPTGRSHGEELEPRRGSEREEETGGLFRVVPGEEIGQTSASSQQTNRLSSPPSAEFSSLSQKSRPSSWEGAGGNVPAWSSTSSQQTNPGSSQGTSGNQWISSTQFTQPGPSGLSWKGAGGNVPAWSSTRSSPAPSAGLWSLPQSGPSSWKGASERRTSDKPLTEEEEKLSKALLYWFNLNNYALDPPHTNFIVKNGKIASLIDDSVDVKEYLQEVIDKTKEEYCVNKKEAYDLNEFPFKFLSNCEKNQETTVVANISRGALLNLKELFSQEHEGKVEIKDIDINIVKKAVKSKKDKWVNFQVREHGLSPKAAIETCCPDESALEYISITKGEGGHWIDRNYDVSEVKSFKEERWPAKGTSKAEKMKSEDNKDSGYSSGFVTDAENVSSKAEATTSGYESMDCENTRGGSPKRTLELSMGMEELTISTDLDATKVEQHSPIKKFRSN